MWYFSFGGGSKGVNNIRVYHNSGHPHAQPDLLPTGKFDPPLQELRGFVIAGGLLYVANAYHRYSQIFVYAADANGEYRFQEIFASKHEVSSLVHPYDLAFDSQGNCYVSSQDTNVVTRLQGPGSALEVAPYLKQQYPPPAKFLAGTIVASSIGALPGAQSPPPPDVFAPHGLEVRFADDSHARVAHSVRGLLFHAGYLYVADEPAHAVKVYDGHTGELRGQIAGDNLSWPDQLLLDATTGVLYIGSSDSDRIVRYNLAQGTPAGTVHPTTSIHGGVKHVSGMAFDAEGYFLGRRKKGEKDQALPARWQRERDGLYF